MKRTIKVFCMFMFLIVLLAGCAEKTEIVATNKVYDILRRGDQYSIRLKKDSEYAMGHDVYDLFTPIENMWREFTDLQSMERAVLEGDFTYNEFWFATYVEKGTKIHDGEALIFNPYELYQPYVPVEATVDERIKWRVWSYNFTFHSDGAGSGGCTVLHEKDYLERVPAFDNEIEEIKESAQKENSRVHIVEEKVDPDTGEYRISYTKTYYNGVESYMKTRQTYETAEKTLYIWKTYYDYDGNEDAAPYRIDICGEENGGYFYFYIYGLRENPDVQWLSQFGIKPFEGNEPPPKAIG